MKSFVKQFKSGSRVINLEFFQKKRGRFWTGEEHIPWEIWQISFNQCDEGEPNPTESITSAMISVAEAVNNQKTFLPKVKLEVTFSINFRSFYVSSDFTFVTDENSNAKIGFEL